MIRTSALDYEVVKICSACRLCGGRDLVCVVPLAETPIVSPNTGGKHARYAAFTAPLHNYLCGRCGHIQLGHVVPSDLLYADYRYKTSISLGLAEHFGRQSRSIIDRIGLTPGDLVVEVGSNDGTLLRHFKNAGMRVQGIDPAKDIADEASAAGIPTFAGILDAGVATSIAETCGRAQAVVANNVLANIDDVTGVLRNVMTLLADDGVFVVETQYALDVYEHTLLDVIYHEHISIFAVRPVAQWLSRNGCELFHAERIPTKGGSIRFWIQKQGGPHQVSQDVADLIKLETATGLFDPSYYRKFSERVAGIRDELHRMIAGRKVAAYGTSVGSVALMHQLVLQDKLDCIFDDAPLKDRLVGPGYDIPVRTWDDTSGHPEIIIILAWRYAPEIARKRAAYRESGGTFLIPLPHLQVMGK